jgi:signal peptidase I
MTEACSRPGSPSVSQLEAELSREKQKHHYFAALRRTIYVLLAVAGLSILVATLWMPVMQIYGSSMNPTLTSGEYVVAVKQKTFHQGDIVAFYVNNRLMIKRVIAKEGDWVELDDQGHVFVNGVLLEEDYVEELSLGNCNISFPYQVPDGTLFLMGDNRATSVDSRTEEMGCIDQSQIVGQVFFRIWPLNRLGVVK